MCLEECIYTSRAACYRIAARLSWALVLQRNAGGTGSRWHRSVPPRTPRWYSANDNEHLLDWYRVIWMRDYAPHARDSHVRCMISSKHQPAAASWRRERTLTSRVMVPRCPPLRSKLSMASSLVQPCSGITSGR